MESSGLVTFPIPADIQALLGPPPVLTDEAAAVYRLGLAKFALLIKPSDVLGWLYVNSLTYDWCEIRLLRSLKPCAIRGRFEAEAKRNNEAEAHEMRRHADIQPWNPMGGDANLFGQWMGDYERVDELLRRAEQRFEDTIRQIDEYKQGLGMRLRRANAIIEGTVLSGLSVSEYANFVATAALCAKAPLRERAQTSVASVAAPTCAEASLSEEAPRPPVTTCAEVARSEEVPATEPSVATTRTESPLSENSPPVSVTTKACAEAPRSPEAEAQADSAPAESRSER